MARDPGQLGEADLAAMTRRFVPTRVDANTAHLPESERRALAKIVAAASLLDDLFLHQVWEGNPALLERLRVDDSALGRARLRYFVLNKGPWSRVDDDRSFIPGVPVPKPAGAAFYPEQMAKAEFEAWVAELDEQAREAALGLYHVIRREPGGELRPVAYAKAYRSFLLPAAALLRQAADLSQDDSLRHYLGLRADSLLSDEYFDSEVAWLEMSSDLDVTFGPYETYEDQLMGLKTSYEAYVGVVDRAASEQLARFAGLLQEIENNLPLDPLYRNRELPPAAPIRVIDLVYASGDGNRGPQTAAFNLPNDERITSSKGFKRVMLKNVQAAKFAKVLLPIAGLVLPQARQAEVLFDVFFTSVLLHELAHGLGPHTAQVGGRTLTLREALRELYSPVEEAKADVISLFANQYLMDKGALDPARERSVYTTFLAGAFRSVRFGIGEAHGRGVALQFNYFTDEGAIAVEPGARTFAVDTAKARVAVAKLAGELLAIEAEGDYARAAALLDRYAVIRPEMQRTLDRLVDVPIDIAPAFSNLEELTTP